MTAAAASFARRIVNEGGSTLDQRIAFAFKAAVARTPNREETANLASLYRKSLRKFLTYGEDASKLANIGTEKTDSSPTSAQADLAAWTVLANVLLNLDETITRE